MMETCDNYEQIFRHNSLTKNETVIFAEVYDRVGTIIRHKHKAYIYPQLCYFVDGIFSNHNTQFIKIPGTRVEVNKIKAYSLKKFLYYGTC